MRIIKYIVIHCTATSQNTSIQLIKNYWKNNLKWKNVGYHYIISADGIIHQLANEKDVTNGVAGFNSNSIHISYIGGIDIKGRSVDNRTKHQKKSMEKLICDLKNKYPDAQIQGHRDFPNVKKDCPCFNAKTEYQLFNFKRN